MVEPLAVEGAKCMCFSSFSSQVEAIVRVTLLFSPPAKKKISASDRINSFLIWAGNEQEKRQFLVLEVPTVIPTFLPKEGPIPQILNSKRFNICIWSTVKLQGTVLQKTCFTFNITLWSRDEANARTMYDIIVGGILTAEKQVRRSKWCSV